MATKICKKNFSSEKGTVKTSSVAIVKRGRPCSKKTIREFVLKNINKMNSYEMAKILNVKPIRIAAAIATLKTHGVLDIENNLTGKKFQTKATAISVTKKETKGGESKSHAFSNYDGLKKQVTRYIFADLIEKSGKLDGKIGGLSAGQCRSEIAINERISLNKFLYEGYEIEVDTCKKMQETIFEKKLNMFAIPKDINLAINNAVESEYSHFNLDFCVNFTSVKSSLIAYFTRNIVQIGGITQITVSTRYNKSTFVNEFGSKDCETKKNLDAFCNFLKLFPNYKIVSYHSYKEGKDATPMLAIFVKRIK
jgi:hypothetical protein